jgi:hypothetical protein
MFCGLIPWKLSSFFVYEEYAATYTVMLTHLSTSTVKIPHWQSVERGLEMLVNTMAPPTEDCPTGKKSLTYGDLLIKVCFGAGFAHCTTFARSKLTLAANPAYLQIPIAVRRSAEIHAGN